ncbi:MAG: DEAD/DEAH box helicase [Bdellovibrionales bacterium]|jgi:ATP-dependent RNA helicase RhlE|nr:DEAD/DEAH box helicase [Bdellovibrionales bacterium]
MSFSKLGLSKQIINAVSDEGYKNPTMIQAQSIPAILSGRDVISDAQTGTGKSAGFILPILEILSKSNRLRGNNTRSLILVPTRELADQVHQSVKKYSTYLPIKSEVVFGGVKINPQMLNLRGGVDILVATPGRLLDLYKKNSIKFTKLEVLVLDEADRMLDLGFIDQIKEILDLLPKNRQNLLFSATFSDEIRELGKSISNDPFEISVTPSNPKLETIEHYLYPLDQIQKTDALIYLFKKEKWKQALVFTSTKHGADKLVTDLIKKGISTAAIHGNKSQAARTKALADFKDGNVKILVATEIISRGIDINQLYKVVNFDLPRRAEGYIHRIGRTGRAGIRGTAISFVNADEFEMLQIIERLLQQLIPRRILEGFIPKVMLAESVLNTKPFKKKKPKKNKKI